MAFAIQQLSDNLHYQSSTNPSRNLRDQGRQQHKIPEYLERRLQPRHESDREARQRETSDQRQQRLQARWNSDHQVIRWERSATCLAVWFFFAWPVVYAGNEKRVISDCKDYRPGEIQTMRQGDEKDQWLASRSDLFRLTCSLCWQQKNEWSVTANTTCQARIRLWGKATRNEWSVTAKTTSQVRMVSAD